MRGLSIFTGGTVLACLLAALAGNAAGASHARQIAFRVTLHATVTKDWDTVTETTEAGCPTSRRAVGRRTIKLRSARATTVLVTFARGRVSYSPPAVRFVEAEVAQTGSLTTRVSAPCTPGTARTRCPRIRPTVRGARYRFFRSRRNELSFRAARLPEIETACPEPAGARAIGTGLHGAQGEISESALADPRIPSQTAIGAVEVTTDLDGAETGRVVERVHWELTFTRKHQR